MLAGYLFGREDIVMQFFATADDPIQFGADLFG
jgi:hypothetical protein